jgi:hypothetical protein
MTSLTRKEFGKFSLLTILLASIVGPISFLTGCSPSSVAAAIIASFGQVLRLLQASGIVTNPTLIAAANAALQAFQAAYDAFQKGTGTADKLAAAAQAALNAVQAFFAATQIGGPLAEVVIALAQIILSTLMSFLSAPVPARYRVASHDIQVVAVKRTLAEYRTDWNEVCAAKGHSELRLK